METHGDSGPNRLPIDQCPGLSQRRRYSRERLLEQWSHVWTKRQSPEWKPRRASVAGCQQQQHNHRQQLLAQHFSCKSAHQFDAKTSASIREARLRQLQQHPRPQSGLVESARIRVSPRREDIQRDVGSIKSKSSSDDISAKNSDHKEKHTANSANRDESIVGSTSRVDAGAIVSGSRADGTHRCSMHSLVNSIGSQKQVACQHQPVESNDNDSCFNDSAGQGDASDLKRAPRHEVSQASGGNGDRLAVNKSAAKLCRRLPHCQATCCSDSASAVVGGQEFSTAATAAAAPTAANMSEKLQSQHKQRKYLILLMALKQMIAERNPVAAEGASKGNCSTCRSRSCSFGMSARSPTTSSTCPVATVSAQTVASGEQRQQQPVAACDSRLGSSRSALIDRLQAELISKSAGSQQATSQSANSEISELGVARKLSRLILGASSRSGAQIGRTRLSTCVTEELSFERLADEMRQLVELQCCAPTPITTTTEDTNDDDDSDDCQASLVNSCDIEPELDNGDEDEDSEEGFSGTRDFWREFVATEEDAGTSSAPSPPPAARGSCKSATITEIRAPSTTGSASTSLCNDSGLEALIIESWLDDHPNFTNDYFMRKASRQLVDEWLVAHAKMTNASVSSQLDLRSASGLSRPISQQSLNVPLRGPLWRAADMAEPLGEPRSAGLMSCANFAFNRPKRSNSQSGGADLGAGTMTPVRKISATDFESRTGNGFLRPMVSTTPDGRATFLSQIPLVKCEEDTMDQRADDSTGRTKDTASRCDDTLMEVQMGQSISPDLSTYKLEGDEEELVHSADEVKLIFELVKNICNDLDIRNLLHKILKNIAILINADKSSLFLVSGEPGHSSRHLVSHLFNVDQDSADAGEPDNCIEIPWGQGIVGYVAESGESLNIANCYDDPRFTNAIDKRTGYVTKHMLCAPIFDKRNEIVGVAQVINKRDGRPFTRSDEIKFKRYLQFCGIGLRNAQSYEHCQLENKRNQVLLELARMVFEEQSTIEQVVHRIMLHTQSLLECQRCQVLLIDDGSDNLEQLLQLPVCSPKSIDRSETATEAEDQEATSAPEWRPHCQLDWDSGEHNPQVELGPSHKLESCESQDRQSQPASKLFSLVFDLESDSSDPVVHNERKFSAQSSIGPRRFPINIGITSYVAMTGETLNIDDAHSHSRFDPSVDEDSDFKHKSILCMPIRNGQRQIIGVSQLINKKNGRPFNKNDEDLFEAFAIFCGLGIHNTLMYERVLKIMAKQRVTFEVLSYHATAPLEEAKKLSIEKVPSCYTLDLASLKFNDFSLDEQFMLKSCLRFFLDLDLMRRFQIDHLTLCNWLLSVQKNYRKVTYHPIVGGNGLKASPVRYHNWRHAFNVGQMMFAIFVNTQICQALGELETLALLIACLCHDLDHRGTNNSFQIKSASPLAELYSTSTMEHHHFDQCVMILNSQGNQILANLSPHEYSRVIVLIEEAILATDLANYFHKRDLFFQLVNSNQFSWQTDPEHKSMLRCMLMTACDVGAITKPWPVQKIVADLVMSEFYQQGDIERNELNIEPIDMMNRNKMSKLPDMQIGFIDSICAPIYTAFAKLFPRELGPLLDGCLANRSVWFDMANSNIQAHISHPNDQSNESEISDPTLPIEEGDDRKLPPENSQRKPL